MKKLIIIFLSIFLILIILLNYKPNKVHVIRNTTSDIIVLNKEHSIDNNIFWILAYDPNIKGNRIEMKIVVDNVNTWNLIEVQKKYFSTYIFRSDGSILLENIKIIE